MKEYGISIETADGVYTRQWLAYPSDADALAQWNDLAQGRRIEIHSGGKLIGVIDDRPAAADAA